MSRVCNVMRQRAFHIGAEFRQSLLAQRHARGHGVAAALHQQSVLHRLTHRPAEIDAGDGTARAGAEAARLQRNGESRPREFFSQP